MSNRMHAAYQRARRGFTLVELLVSVLILSLALVSLSQLYLAGMWTTQKARYLSLATERVQAEMERVQDLGILNLINGPTEASYPGDEYTYQSDNHGVSFTEETLPEGKGTVTWQPYPPSTTGNEHLLRVDVEITWKGASKSQSQVHITTLLTNRY